MSEQRSVRGRLLHPMQRTHYREFDALDDVSFEIAEGEFFGIVGRNGSGKSTMLKTLAGIYMADSGTIDVRGSLAPFIELGVGFNFELSGRDNVFLNGALLGLSKKQLRERYDHIVKFAELEEFMELKLANFSSGMQVRLAFAIAVESDADILLIDEVLAVGDERFQRKCFDVFRARKAAGKTVVFVSHDMGAVREFCDRALLLDNGRPIACADSRTIAEHYIKLNMPEEAERELEFDTGWIGDVSIRPSTELDEVVQIRHGDRVELSTTITAHRRIARPSYGFIVTDGRGRHLIASNTAYADTAPDAVEAGDTVRVGFTFDNILGSGSHLVTVTLEDLDLDEPIDVRRDCFQFTSEIDDPTMALIEVPHDWNVAAAVTP
jgi:ABC-type polysaccharide/polyol phosphate transport system ATPase subunit